LISDLFQYVAIIVGILAVSVLAAGLLWQHPVAVALITLAISMALDCLQFAEEGAQIGSINVYVDDIACLLLLMAGTVVVLRKRKLPERRTWPAIALLACAAINLARGATEVGLKAAGNGGRNLIYLIAPSVALLLLRPALRGSPKLLTKYLLGIGCALTIVALCRWTGALAIPQETADDFSTGWAQASGRELPRVLPAEYAIVIGQALLAVVYLQVSRGVRWWGMCVAGVLAATTFALQHRSVWVSTAVGLTWLAVRTLRPSQRSWLKLAAAVFVGLTVIVIVAGSERVDRAISLAKVNLEETQEQNSTWNWRVEGFAEATERVFSSGTFEMLLGPPSGGDLGSGASFASVHIHSRYVATLAYYGIFGTIVLIIWLSAVAKKIGGRVRDRRGGGPEMLIDTALLQALLLSQLVYFVPYSGGMIQGAMTAFIWLSAPSPVRVLRHSFQRKQRVGCPTSLITPLGSDRALTAQPSR
jgi:hypothetical protein